jgi:hypothetical protein
MSDALSSPTLCQTIHSGCLPGAPVLPSSTGTLISMGPVMRVLRGLITVMLPTPNDCKPGAQAKHNSTESLVQAHIAGPYPEDAHRGEGFATAWHAGIRGSTVLHSSYTRLGRGGALSWTAFNISWPASQSASWMLLPLVTTGSRDRPQGLNWAYLDKVRQGFLHIAGTVIRVRWINKSRAEIQANKLHSTQPHHTMP